MNGCRYLIRALVWTAIGHAVGASIVSAQSPYPMSSAPRPATPGGPASPTPPKTQPPSQPTLRGPEPHDLDPAYSPYRRPADPARQAVITSGPADCWNRSGVQLEYLSWWLNGTQLPVLVATGNPADAVPGALGQPGTRVLYGGDTLDSGRFSGGRLHAEFWSGQGNPWGLEIGGFLLEQRSEQFGIGSDASGVPALFIPIYRPDVGREGSYMISAPSTAVDGPFLGNVAIATRSQLWGAEANGLTNLTTNNQMTVDLLYGVRYLDLDESFDLNATGLVDTAMGVRSSIWDSIGARSQFFGGQLGTRVRYRWERLALEMTAKVALGDSHDSVSYSGGNTQIGAALGSAQGNYAGGIFTQPSNLGRSSSDQFSVAPQAQIKTSYQIAGGVRVMVGYDFLYWSRVVRAGSQVDHSVNLSQSQGLNPAGNGVLIGPARPGSEPVYRDLVVHGLSVGLEYRY